MRDSVEPQDFSGCVELVPLPETTQAVACLEAAHLGGATGLHFLAFVCAFFWPFNVIFSGAL